MIDVFEFSARGPAVNGEGIVSFFDALARQGISRAIPNLKAQLGVVRGSFSPIPFVVGVAGGGRCYIASFTRMYMDGASDELGRSKSAVLKLFAPVVGMSGPTARGLGMDDIVVVNNNLHPTCHVGDWSMLDAKAMTEALVEKYPGRAIWVRGLTDYLHADEISRLRAAGYLITPSRPIEILDPTVPGWKVRPTLRTDLNRVNRLPGMTPFAGGPFNDADFAVMQRLTHSATVLAHSDLMPHYSAEFFRACANWSDCLFVGLRDDNGQIRAFTTIIVGERCLTTGTIGFDIAEEHARRIYPAIIAMILGQGVALRRPVNVGYGAHEFKRHRGTKPALEMNAFYVRHLPMVKRHLWQTTAGAMGALAGPVMKRL